MFGHSFWEIARFGLHGKGDNRERQSVKRKIRLVETPQLGRVPGPKQGGVLAGRGIPEYWFDSARNIGSSTCISLHGGCLGVFLDCNPTSLFWTSKISETHIKMFLSP